MRTVNLVIFVVAVLGAIQSLRLFVLDRSSVRATAFWTGLWLAVAIFGLRPDWVDSLMVPLMMHSRTFFILVVAAFLLFRLQFKSSEQNERLQRRIGHLAQEIALLRLELERRTAQRAENDVPNAELEPLQKAT